MGITNPDQQEDFLEGNNAQKTGAVKMVSFVRLFTLRNTIVYNIYKTCMDKNQSENLLKELSTEVQIVFYDNYERVASLRTRTTMLIKKIFGNDSSYLEQLKNISFNSRFDFGTSDSLAKSAFNIGKQSFLSLLDTMLEDLQLSSDNSSEVLVSEANATQVSNDRIFLVHGHNEEMKQAVARTIEQLGLEPIILHEKANRGRTIIQKFTEHSDVSFAIALLSADDVGYTINDKPENGKFRARQNVILELGFFLGKIGLQNVVALYETDDNFEFPSDYQGVIFIPYDKGGRWKIDLLRELKASNFNVDANRII